MNKLKYYIATEYPIELSNKLKEYISIYSKRKNNNKLITLKELENINIDLRNLLKNNFIYEIEFKNTNMPLKENLIDLINKIIKYNIFNGFNAVEIYCYKEKCSKVVNLKIKDINENVFFEENTLITIGQFNLKEINTLIEHEKNLKILALEKVQNFFILDILSGVKFIYNEQGKIEEIETSLYIENININNSNLELNSSHNIFKLENENFEDKKNAFESTIYSKYKEKNFIDDGMKDICITRLIYNTKKVLEKIDNIKIKLEIYY